MRGRYDHVSHHGLHHLCQSLDSGRRYGHGQGRRDCRDLRSQCPGHHSSGAVCQCPDRHGTGHGTQCVFRVQPGPGRRCDLADGPGCGVSLRRVLYDTHGAGAQTQTRGGHPGCVDLCHFRGHWSVHHIHWIAKPGSGHGGSRHPDQGRPPDCHSRHWPGRSTRHDLSGGQTNQGGPVDRGCGVHGPGPGPGQGAHARGMVCEFQHPGRGLQTRHPRRTEVESVRQYLQSDVHGHV